ncbi:Hypothetical predicted protein [Olea europaea subsp. europaea]|uniref:Uncharacterized protein n=1 Tax=Olea europaea subsp. europaea TaxID=158383 RepID=A0A8S0UJ74_OLEEU|nr:Hypothetical predicted protein [Olea europaea subsp. europaea]
MLSEICTYALLSGQGGFGLVDPSLPLLPPPTCAPILCWPFERTDLQTMSVGLLACWPVGLLGCGLRPWTVRMDCKCKLSLILSSGSETGHFLSHEISCIGGRLETGECVSNNGDPLYVSTACFLLGVSSSRFRHAIHYGAVLQPQYPVTKSGRRRERIRRETGKKRKEERRHFWNNYSGRGLGRRNNFSRPEPPVRGKAKPPSRSDLLIAGLHSQHGAVPFRCKILAGDVPAMWSWTVCPLWLCGSVALWLCGSVALWPCGPVALEQWQEQRCRGHLHA